MVSTGRKGKYSFVSLVRGDHPGAPCRRDPSKQNPWIRDRVVPFPWKSVYLKKITAGLETNLGEANVSFVLSALLKHNPTAVEENHMSC